MSKVIWVILLAVVSNSAIAGWVRFGSSELLTRYIYLDTITKKGNKVKMWEMYDYNKPRENSNPFMSEMAQYEYDCNSMQIRKIVSTFYSGKMGGGEYLHTESFTDAFKPITLGVQVAFWQLACVPIPTKWEAALYGKSGNLNYVNAASIRKTGDNVTMWSLTDLKTADHYDQKQFMSAIERREYNCKSGQMRLLFAAVYNENMGKGVLVDAMVNWEDWMLTPTGSTGEVLWKIACGIIVPH